MSTSDSIEREPARGPAQASAPASATHDDADVVGSVVDGRYRIDALVGRGGMGSVYRGEHVTLRRPVAVKLLHPMLAQLPEVARRFEREAFAIGRIEHANCVNVTDFGSLEDGSLFLVMEYLEGTSLGDLLEEEKRFSARRTLGILTHVLRGLGHAHAAGIVHRDVKPENVIIVEQDGDPNFAKILDFGIAKLLGTAENDDGGAKLTQAGVTFGTPIYMSPEQALGSPVDARADLYAASVMAFEMICGRAPFVADDKIEVLSMHTAREVPSFAEVDPTLSVPNGVETLIRKGLAKRPAERYADAKEYLHCIDEVLLHLDDSSPPPPTAPVNATIGAASASGANQARGKARPLGTVPVTYPPPVEDNNDVRVAKTVGRAETLGPTDSPFAKAKTIVIVAIVGIGIVFFVASTRSTDGVRPIATAPTHDASVAETAAALFDRGDPDGVIALLEKDTKELENVRSKLLLGHAYAAKRRNKDALDVYRAVTDADPTLAKNEALIANLVVMFDDGSTATALSAAELLYERTHDAAAADRLAEIAATTQNNELREKAIGLLDRHGLSDRADWLAIYSSELKYGETCKERQPAVSKLRALGNRAAIEVLEDARYRKGQTGRWRGKNVNVCMTKDIESALKYLSELPE